MKRLVIAAVASLLLAACQNPTQPAVTEIHVSSGVMTPRITMDVIPVGGVSALDSAACAAEPALDEISSTLDFIWLACWNRRSGSLASARSTTSSNRPSTGAFFDGGSNCPIGTSPVSNS